MKTNNETLSLQRLLVTLLNLRVLIAVTVGEVVPPYIPVENITINCGSFSHSLASDGRLWSAENNSRFPVLHSGNKQSLFLSASTGYEPYITSRLSYSEFTYMIPLTAGPKFIRLHFHLHSYPGFNLSKAFFTVKAGRFTLLRNFSALFHAQGKETLVKEFCANVEDGETLNITFSPSSVISDAYAFVNGIEIVSMPTNLYYRPASDEGVPLLGHPTGRFYSWGNNTALEMMHRINVGGRQIAPAEDTGMYRAWSGDDDYLAVARPSALPVNTSVNLSFSAVPSFSAPGSIYIVARIMGVNKTTNENYNLTWEFPVDSDFNYFVRLHFCEFQIEITKVGDRVFEIFIANNTAETQADVIAWSGGNGVPIYRDYAVAIRNKGNQKKQNLSIQLQPDPEWGTKYSDAILNGVEIFKLSRSGDLSGPNPDPTLVLHRPNPDPTLVLHLGKKRTINIVVVVAAPVTGFVTISLLLFVIFRIRSNKFANNSCPSLPSDICRHFSLREIKTATNNFDKNLIIGRGGFGEVYKGFANAGSTPVAIKRLNPGSQQGVLEFRTEIEMLSKLRHQNLVSLIGYCEDNKEMILVYDYMIHGTLRDHLYNTDNPPLQWEQRLKMCIGAAHGLHYLHRGPNHTIIHRDVKTTNILMQGSEINGNDENHANDSSSIDYHVLFTSGSGSMRVGR
ncbi:receptor-like protein kinase FERONIA [Gossypium australe]|uniref:Receptor-like protein kinase FERONIA n=1 Tax=Gossypium australe TaxID=47621 RepID=A0A5B6UQR6_9ROSI|nr:receptor-like protein kinase FERONIA [Gossypium australe]